MKNSGIQWTTHTFNPWIGCAKVSEACKHCYAEVATPTRTLRAKGLEVWGAPTTTARQRTGVANWRQPLKWNREARAAGKRARVFCASLADVFEDHPSLDAWRADLWTLIEETPALDWQLLTKRPENIRAMVPPAWLKSWPAHVWVGTTVETQARAEERIPHLLRVPAPVRFLSMEPLLGPVDLNPPTCPRCGGHDSEPGSDGATPFCRNCGESDGNGEEMEFGAWLDPCASESQPGISWVIVGGESGPSARPFDLAWARSIIAQCSDAGVPVFVKQLGAHPVDSSRAAIYQPCFIGGKPIIRTTVHMADAPEVARARVDEADDRLRLARPQVQHPLYLREHFRYVDAHGGDPAEWPADLRVREMPEGAR